MISIWFVTGICVIIGVFLAVFSSFRRKKTPEWVKKVKIIPASDIKGSGTFAVSWSRTDTKIYNLIGKDRHGGFEEFNNTTWFIKDLDLVRQVLVKDFDHFVNRRLFDMPQDKCMHLMLFNHEGQAWKDLRATLSPTFTTGKIRRMFPIFDRSGRNFAKFFQTQCQDSNSDSIETDILDGLGRYAMDVIAASAFGVDSRVWTESDPAFARMGNRIQYQFQGFWPVFKILIVMVAPSIAKLLRLKISDQVALRFFSSVVNQTVDTRRKNPTEFTNQTDFLQLMLDTQIGNLTTDENDESEIEKYSKKKVALSDELMLSQSMMFFSNGFETITTVLTFALYELAVNEEIQERLADEVKKAFNNQELTYDGCQDMVYLNKFVSEVLRKYPPGVRAERRCSRDYPIDNIVIPKDTIAVVSIYAIHHDPEIYPDPERFDPERFNPEEIKRRHPYAYFPFGHGPRNCIAERFALAEVKSAVAHVVHSFKVSPSAETMIPVQLQETVALKPVNGMKLKFTIRNPV